jgi:glycosyltransferase involved in cell wall biosynthesis
MMKKILVLLTNPIDNDSRVKKEINSLTKNNFDVTLISVNSKESFIKNHFILKYNQYFRIHGVKFLVLSIKFLFTIIKCLKNVDFIHCNDAITLHLGLAAKFLKPKVKLIYDSHELGSKRVGSKLSNLYFFLIEKISLRFVDKTINVSPSIAQWYEDKYKIPRPLIVLNCPPKANAFYKKNIFREKFGISETSKIFLYQGGFSKGRGIPHILEAFKKLDKNKYSVVFMGYGPMDLEIQNASKTYSNIFFHKAVSQNELMDYTSSADWGLVLIENYCLSYNYCLPNKLFECIQAEIPIIASNLLELSNLVSTWKLGVVAEQINEMGLINAIKKTDSINPHDLLPNLKNAKNLYCWEMQEKVLLSAYNAPNLI